MIEPTSDDSGSLARATAVMAAGTVLSRLTGFGRVFALAYAIGFTRLADSYNLANTTPHVVYELAIGGVLSGTLVPVFMRHSRDADRGAGAISAVVTAVSAGLAVLAVLVALAAPLIVGAYTIGPGVPDASRQREVAAALLRLFAPQVICFGAITLTTALLQARRRFAAPMYAPVLANLVIIAVLLATPALASGLSLDSVRRQPSVIVLLGLGTTAGFLLQAVAQIAALRGTGLRLRVAWHLRHPAVREVARLSGWTVGFTIANQIALWVSLLLANRRSGGVSAYQAAFVFFSLPHAVVTVSVMSALLPDLSGLWQSGERRAFAGRTGWGLRTTAAAVLPGATGLALLAGPIVTVALQHGALKASAAGLTADTLRAFALGLPGFSAYLLLMRCYMAMSDTRSIFWLYVVENGANIVLALALFPVLGVPGLALSYGLSYSLAAVVSVAHLRRRVDSIGSGLAAPLARIAMATTACAGAVVLSRRLAPSAASWQAVGGILAGVTVYLFAAMLLQVDEVRQFVRRRAT